jgi:hypothetical protein
MRTWFAIALAACGGPAPPTAPPPPNTSTFTCSAGLAPIRVGCPGPGADLTSITIACTSANLGLNPSPPPQPTSRATVTIGDFSTVNGRVVPIGPTTPCGPNGLPSNGVTITFGLSFTGDFFSGGAAVPFCFTRSRGDFTQWGVSDPLVATLDGMLKSSIVGGIEQSIIDRMNGTLGLPAGMPPRCANWRSL